MKSANRLTLVGVLGKSPELRESKAGTKYCYVAIATTESYKPKDSEEWKDETTWHDVAFFGKDAESGRTRVIAYMSRQNSSTEKKKSVKKQCPLQAL
jgi:single stranded DNA-binding protein